MSVYLCCKRKDILVHTLCAFLLTSDWLINRLVQSLSGVAVVLYGNHSRRQLPTAVWPVISRW
jgi:hypothetical protein